MLIMFIIMLPVQIAIAAIVSIFVFFLISRYKNYIRVGNDFYKAIMFSFLIPGLGLLYIDKRDKALTWHVMQYIFSAIPFFISRFAEIDNKYYGMIIATPFILQIYVTAIEYKRKHGDVEKIFR